MPTSIASCAGIVRALLVVAAASVLLVVPDEAAAKTRHAFVVGVGSYRENSGVPKLLAPASDAEQMKNALEAKGIAFVVDLVKDNDVRDKAAFEAALKRFLSRVRPKDEVLFYFSGHGFHIPDKGNFFLLPDAKGQSAYLQDLGAAEKRDLDNDDKRERRYREWLASVSISEDAVEKAIADTKADVIIIVADACRSLIGKAKGFTPVSNGLALPREMAAGTYRIYSASPGQVSLDSPDRGATSRTAATDSQSSKSGEKKDEKREASLFTRVLLQELHVPRLEINILFSKVKIAVREQARALGTQQIPDFYDSKEATNFYFRSDAATSDLQVRCATAENELAQLRYGVAVGGVSRDELERKRGELAPCGPEFSGEIDKLLRFEGQGAGALSTSSLGEFAGVANTDDPILLCDTYGSSPLDPNRPQDIAGYEVQKIALESLNKPEERAKAIASMSKVTAGCEAAAKARPRVARYKFNLARTHFALATLTADPLVREASLVQASKNNQEAVDIGYVAAYNNLALLHQNGEFYETSGSALKRLPPDRAKAFEYFKRGAELGHVVAQYNLGMAYKNGELGTEAAASTGQTRSDAALPTTRTREALAFQQLSRAAEGGFVPAMIQTAILLHDWPGIQPNPKRAVELLEVAASRGSWEAMYWLGEVYRVGKLRDPGEAVVWHARAAEAGDTRSQTKLARMLLDGHGLPASQPDAAGRYLRLAAAAGSIEAQMLLADRLRDGKVSFRPRIDGKVDGGAAEIFALYESAFARGKPEAGLKLARLFRTGFPVQRPSDAIPKSPSEAAKRLWDTIDKVRGADPTSLEADPRIEVLAAAELIKMFDAGEAKGVGGPDVITTDQAEQLKRDYGDVDRLMYIRVSAVGPVNCNSEDFWALIWDGNRGPVPTESQFDWFERYYKCKLTAAADRDQGEKSDRSEKAKRDAVKEADLGVPKKTRDIFKREFEAALKEKEQKSKEKKRSFVDRMVTLVSTEKSKK